MNPELYPLRPSVYTMNPDLYLSNQSRFGPTLNLMNLEVVKRPPFDDPEVILEPDDQSDVEVEILPIQYIYIDISKVQRTIN